MKALQPMIFKIIPALLDFDRKDDLSDSFIQVYQDQKLGDEFPKKRKRKPKEKVASSLPGTTSDCDINENADIKVSFDRFLIFE